jgi:hypothetical protein
MRMPGFTAEASAYKTSEHHPMVGDHSQAPGTIHPASCIGECFHECMSFGHMSASGCMVLCRVECRHPNL